VAEKKCPLPSNGIASQRSLSYLPGDVVSITLLGSDGKCATSNRIRHPKDVSSALLGVLELLVRGLKNRRSIPLQTNTST
jgi:hypothetical protein